MSNGKKIALAFTGLMLALVGLRIYLIHRANNEDVPLKAKAEVPKLSDDDAVYPRKLRPDSLRDLRAMIGTTVWMSAGGQMDFYRDSGKHVDYAKPVGAVEGATPMLIRDVFEQVAPHSGRAVFRIPPGQKHVLLAFTMPNSADPKTLYALPVGNYDDGSYNLHTDEIFFYDDPRVLYKHWGAETWAHIDKHEIVPGMSENQVMMSVGEVMTPHSDSVGNRTVDYDHNGHPVTVTFENNKAVKITPGS